MLLPLLEKRRSIRKFREREIESEKIGTLLEAALRAPSSMNRRPWEFIVVRDREMLKRLSMSKPHGASFLKNAPLGIVVCADPLRCDVWVEDASIASAFLLLAAESLGLGACWIQIRARMYDGQKSATAYIAEQLDIPDHLEVEAIVAVGYPDEEKSPHHKEDLPYEKIHYEKYGGRSGSSKIRMNRSQD